MEISATSFWVQKLGSTESEYEDAFYPSGPVSSRLEHSRFAIADGATDSSYARLWAAILAEAFVELATLGERHPDAKDVLAVLPELQRRWTAEVGEKPLPWYAEEKAKAGAFSSLLGITLSDDPVAANVGRWEALAVGDSCLVQVRAERAELKWPIEHSSLFDESPFLIPSNPKSSAALDQNIVSRVGDIRTGDSFYLMTDAIACWFISEDERGKSPWRVLRDLDTSDGQDSFSQLVAGLRSRREVRNDDCTLTRIDVSFG